MRGIIYCILALVASLKRAPLPPKNGRLLPRPHATKKIGPQMHRSKECGSCICLSCLTENARLSVPRTAAHHIPCKGSSKIPPVHFALTKQASSKQAARVVATEKIRSLLRLLDLGRPSLDRLAFGPYLDRQLLALHTLCVLEESMIRHSACVGALRRQQLQHGQE